MYVRPVNDAPVIHYVAVPLLLVLVQLIQQLLVMLACSRVRVAVAAAAAAVAAVLLVECSCVFSLTAAQRPLTMGAATASGVTVKLQYLLSSAE
jgi:hypothetical protein